MGRALVVCVYICVLQYTVLYVCKCVLVGIVLQLDSRIEREGEGDLTLESDIVRINLPNGGTVCSTCFIRRRRSSIEYYIKVYYDGSSL